MKLIGNIVLVEPLPKKTISEGGIHFVMRYRDDDMQWKVLEVGSGTIVRKKGKPDVHIPIELEPGDHCLTPMVCGNKYVFKDGRRILDANEIIAKWKP